MHADDVLKIIRLRNIITTFRDYYSFAKNDNIILIHINSHFSNLETSIIHR